jgi:hypothetical protein
MNFKLLAGVLLLVGWFAVGASAQITQDPLDEGYADTMYFVINPPVVSATSQTVTAGLYVYNDARVIGAIGGEFAWDNSKLRLVSGVLSPEGAEAFDFGKGYFHYKNKADSSNKYQMFQIGAFRAAAETGLQPSSTAKLVATYTFTASSWTATDKFCISLSADTSKLTLVNDSSVEYTPIWGGTECVGFIPTGVLQTSVSSLSFSGTVGGTIDSKSFGVTEAGGTAIAYTASTTTSWLTLGATTPTPGTVTVGINTTGLTANDYVGTITLSSAAATNSPTVTVNLHLAAANQPPVLNSIGNRVVDENSLLQFTVTATDPESAVPILTTSALPGTAAFVDNHNGTGTFTWTPNFNNAGAYPVTFTASDGSLTDFETITITVNNVNRPPVLAAIGPRTGYEKALLTFNVSATDPDLTTLIMSATEMPSGAMFVDHGNGTATFSWVPSNTDAGFHAIWVIASDGNLADSELVTIEVIDTDGFVVDSSSFGFEVRFNGPNPGPRTFHLSAGDNSSVPFTATTAATWFTVDPTTGETPRDISINVNTDGLGAGTYRDSIQISELPSANKSTEAYVPIWVYVNLEIQYEISVAPDTLYLFQSEGDAIPASSSFQVTETGNGAIAFTATTEANWFHLDPAAGTTTAGVTVTANSTDLAPNDYFDSVLVTAGTATNSPLKVYVHLTVSPCPQFATPVVTFNTTTFAGQPASIEGNVAIASSTEDPIPWATSASDAFSFDPASGITGVNPTTHMIYNRTFAVQGTYADTAKIVTNYTEVPEGWACPTEMLVVVNVTVNRAPSADTIIVVTTPAVPGMRVGVPVLITNSCPLTGLGLSLNWTGGMVLDSVSFEGSVLSYVENKNVAINNDLHDVTITMAVGSQALIPIGSQQLMGTLFFALPCEIENGTYTFNLGAYPPLTPADVYYYRNCGDEVETEFPEYNVPGAIIVGTASNYVCGYVVDPDDNDIEGATVELWADYPLTDPLLTTQSSSLGGFAFDDIMVIPFDLYAYKEGYYPGKVENINFGDKGVKIVLQPLPELTTTSQWVDYFCPLDEETNANYFLGAKVPVGAVVEAFTQNNLLVGQTMVRNRGQYGFMPVYRANNQFNDNGAVTGNRIHFTINAMDAVATGNTLYPADYDTVEVCLEVRGTVEKTCTLVEGWNLISWNVNTDGDGILDVLAPIMDNVEVVLGFERGGLTFDPNLPRFSTLWTVDHLSGYWVKIKGVSQIDLTLTGLPVLESTPIALTPGWNLVSYLPEESWPVEQALTSVEGITLFAYGFPGGDIQVWQPGSQFNQLETMDPCNGYWIKTNAAGTLVYGLEAGVPSERTTVQEVALSTDGVVPTTNWINLYSSDLKLDNQPVVSGVRISAYSVDGNNLVGSFTTTTTGEFGFMPVYADAAGENLVGLSAGDQFYLKVDDVKTSEIFTWTSNGDRIEVTELATANSNTTVVPDSYSLSQNYPNPFNPSTVIKFGMPTAGRARIEIFNVLGASVAVVFDGQETAGEHQVVWDGRTSDGNPTASGVYFYRLTADNYTETRKMMLLK